MSIREDERRQRLTYIAARLREIQAEIALGEQKWHGQIPIDQMVPYTALIDEQRALRQERDLLERPDMTPELAIEYADRAWDMVSRLDVEIIPSLTARVGGLEARILGLETHFVTWFRKDADERRRGWIIANVYRIGVVVLVVFDIAARWR